MVQTTGYLAIPHSLTCLMRVGPLLALVPAYRVEPVWDRATPLIAINIV
jgi:hypothetical protein